MAHSANHSKRVHKWQHSKAGLSQSSELQLKLVAVYIYPLNIVFVFNTSRKALRALKSWHRVFDTALQDGEKKAPFALDTSRWKQASSFNGRVPMKRVFYAASWL